MPQFLLGNAGMPRRYYSYPAALPVAPRALDRRRLLLAPGARCSRSSTSRWRAHAGGSAPAESVGLVAASSGSPRRRRRSTTSSSRPTSTHGPYDYDARGAPRERRRARRVSYATSRRAATTRCASACGCSSASELAALRRPVRALRRLPRHVSRTTSRSGVAHNNVADRHRQHGRADRPRSFTVALGGPRAAHGQRRAPHRSPRRRDRCSASTFLVLKAIEYGQHLREGLAPGVVLPLAGARRRTARRCSSRSTT